MSLESFSFKNTVKIVFGKDAVEKLGPIIKERDVKKLLVVFGSNSSKTNGVYERVTKVLTANEIAWIELWGVQPNPLITKVREGSDIVKNPSNGIEGILSVGGGSVIDTGKAICYGGRYDGDPWDFYSKPSTVPKSGGLPLFTVLTLSATASEFDAASVISNPETKLKLPAFYPTMPVASAIDPSIQFSLPWRQVMCGAVDSLSHLMESYFSRPNESITGREVNLGFQRSVLKSMEIIVKNPKDYNARGSFCWAVACALSNYQNTGLTGDFNVHNIEHAISAYNDKVAHGEGLAVISIKYYPWLYKKKPELEPFFEEWAERVFGTTDVQEAFKLFGELYTLWKTPKNLGDINVPKEAISEIVKIEEQHRQIGRRGRWWTLTNEDTTEILTLAV